MRYAAHPTYESPYRRSALALCCLTAILAVSGAALVAIIRYAPSADLVPFVLTWGAVTVLSIVAVMFVGLRTHRWTVEAGGIRIEERPRVRWTGLRRHASVPFADIKALRRVQSGFDAQIEVATRHGTAYRLTQAFVPATGALKGPDAASLESFLNEIRTAMERSGHAVPAVVEGLCFWNRPPGLALLGVLFVLSLAIAGAAVYSLFWMPPPVRPRHGEMLAILAVLPFGAGWLWLKCWRRRREVLAAR